MPDITSLTRGQPVHYHSKDSDDRTPCHAIIAHVDHANTENNQKPRVHLAVLLPNGQWTRRLAVPYSDDPDDENNRWTEALT